MLRVLPFLWRQNLNVISAAHAQTHRPVTCGFLIPAKLRPMVKPEGLSMAPFQNPTYRYGEFSNTI
jgi:hypothetical protein